LIEIRLIEPKSAGNQDITHLLLFALCTDRSVNVVVKRVYVRGFGKTIWLAWKSS
jgi:hypothetical protein